MDAKRGHRKWLTGLVVVALGAALLVAVPADRTEAHDAIAHASNSATVDPPQPAPQFGTPPPGATTWKGKWSRWNHHSVPWRCDVTPAQTQVSPPTWPPTAYYVQTRTYIGCAAANVHISSGDQVLGAATHGQWRYSGCTQFSPPGGAGCGHRLSASATAPVVAGLDRFTAFFGTSITNEARAALIAQARARFRFIDNGRHQTWRYVFCGDTLADDWWDGRNLVSGYRHHALERTAYYGKDPDRTYAGVAGATNLPPASQRATGYRPEPAAGIDPSVPAQWAACWDADPLTVRAGPDVSVVSGSPAPVLIELRRGDTSTVAPCVEVDWSTHNGSAVAPPDYTAGSGTVAFPLGTLGVSVPSATRSVTIATQPNTPGETDESFQVRIDSAVECGTTTAVQIEARDRAPVTIQGTPAPTAIWVPGRIEVVEGDPGDGTTVTIPVTHNGMSGDVTSVGFTVVGANTAHPDRATAGSDYTAPSPPAVFGPAVSVDVVADIIEDTACEPTETFEVILDPSSVLPAGAASITARATLVTIIDDDCGTTTVVGSCNEQQPSATHSEGTPIGTHPSRGACPVVHTWDTWPGPRNAHRGSAPARGDCSAAHATHDSYNMFAGYAYRLPILGNDDVRSASIELVEGPQEGDLQWPPNTDGKVIYEAADWASGSDEFAYRLRYGPGVWDHCTARVQITFLDSPPKTRGTGVVLLHPEQSGFEAADWTHRVEQYEDVGLDIHPGNLSDRHVVRATWREWSSTSWTCRRRGSVTVGDPDYNGHTIPPGTPHYGGQTSMSGPFAVTYHAGNGTTSASSFSWTVTVTDTDDHLSHITPQHAGYNQPHTHTTT